MKETSHKLYQFIQDNSTQIWTLFSVMLGGMVTYISTSMAEKRKNKRHFQREKMDQVLIPYCTCIENTIEIIKKIYDSKSICKKEEFKNWLESINKPSEYLSANKRVFLKSSSRKLLQNYKNQINDFQVTLDKEVTSCLIQYKSYISGCLRGFNSESMDIKILLNENSSTKLKKAIINKSEISLINQVESYNFIHNDDPDNYTEIKIDIDDECREWWGRISCGDISYEDISDLEVRIACELLEYIDDNVEDEKEVISKIVNKMHSGHILKNLIETLEKIQKNIIKEIDRIAN